MLIPCSESDVYADVGLNLESLSQNNAELRT